MSNKPSRPTQNPQSEMLTLLVTSLRRRGLLAGVLGLILAGAGAAITLVVWEPVYDARQYVMVHENREFSDIMEESRFKTDPKSVLAPINSPFILGKLLLNEDIQKRPELDEATLAKMVRYEAAGGEYYAIVCRDQSPDFAAMVAENLAKLLISLHKAKRDESLNLLKERLNEEIKNEQLEIEKIINQLAMLNEQRILPSSVDEESIDPDGSIFVDMLMRKYDQEIEKRQLEEEVSAKKRAFENNEFEIDNSNIEMRVAGSSQILNIDQQIRMYENQIATSPHLGSKNPEIVNLNRNIAQLKQIRQETFDRLMEQERAQQTMVRKQQITNDITELERQIARCDLKIAEYRKESDKAKENLRKANKINFDFDQKLREQQRAYDRLDGWINAQARIDSKDKSLYYVTFADSETVTPPSSPVETFPLKILAIVVPSALFLPFLAGFGWEFLQRRVSSPDQIKLHDRFELLGEVANLPVQSRRPAISGSKRATQQLRLYEESVDNVSAILSHSKDERPQALAVTSAASNEGKTTLATQLAISAARSDYGRTLLIDADLRDPSLHRLFDGSLDVGLTDVIAETESLASAVLHTQIDNLDVLTAGKIKSNPRRYFSNGGWTRLLDEARRQYAQVIVDTPPVLAASEALAIAKACDSTVVCVLRDISRIDSVRSAHSRLSSAGVNIAGCVFGGVPQSSYAYKYGSYGYNLS